MSTKPIVVITSWPDAKLARTVAEELINERLAACVNIQDNSLSIYRWKEQVENGKETVLTIKTTQQCWDELQATILKHHPYDVPKIIATDISCGNPAYINWITESCLP